jgi:acyl-phosphate glycerol 3-phosphate acyltransferase
MAFVIGLLLAAYLLGAVPFGYLVARLKGVDILKQGSGNIGATNVGRLLGRRLGVLVFALDFLKGALPAALGRSLAGATGSGLTGDELGVLAGLAAFLGHMFPVYLRFRGGKGVATGFGVVTVLVPGPTAVAALVWLATVSATRIVSAASVTAATALGAVRLVLTPSPFAPDRRALTLFCLAAAALVVVRHHANLARLARGTENRLKDSAVMRRLAKTIHVLALALWFGGASFFTFIAAPLLFQNFEAIGSTPPADRPPWLPLPAGFTKEQGTQLAGVAINPIFPPFFLLQGLCGLLATITALAWVRLPGRVHRIRFAVTAAGLATVLLSWPLGQHVSTLRLERYTADATTAEAARQAFASWHLASLGLQFVTIILAGVATALAAWLPGDPTPPFSGEPKAAAPAPAAPR